MLAAGLRALGSLSRLVHHEEIPRAAGEGVGGKYRCGVFGRMPIGSSLTPGGWHAVGPLPRRARWLRSKQEALERLEWRIDAVVGAVDHAATIGVVPTWATHIWCSGNVRVAGIGRHRPGAT